MTKRYEIDRTASPVQGAIAVVKQMQANGVDDLILMHQGAEDPSFDTPVRRILAEYSGSSSPAYNTEAGGPMDVREEAAGHIHRFLGINASTHRTLVLQQSGRSGLGEAFYWSAAGYEGQYIRGLAPSDRWPMVDGRAKRADIHLEPYLVKKGQVGDEIEATLERLGDGDNLAVLYENFPHNPTGTHITKDDSSTIRGALDKINDKRAHKFKPPMTRLIDNPYFMACPRNLHPDDCYLNSGYQNTLPVELAAETPWIAVISFSKALGTARPGLHAIVTSHEELTAKIKKAMTEDDAVSYDPAFMEKAKTIWSPESDEMVLEHYGALRTKYEANRAHVDRILGDVVVPGDPGMTCLIKVPGDEFEFFNYLANDFHVAAVPNGTGKLRLALRSQPDVVEKGLERIREALDKYEPAVA